MNHKIILIFYLCFGYCTSGINGDTNDDYHNDDYDYEYDDTTSKAASKEFNRISINTTKSTNMTEISLLSTKVYANLGENVTLDCNTSTYINDLSKDVFMWYKNNVVITSGEISISKNVELLQNKSILIRNINIHDYGDYYCKILPSNFKFKVTLAATNDTLNIYCDDEQVTNKSIIFRQGESHVLKCIANAGNESHIKWSFNGQRAENLVSQVIGDKIYFDVIAEEHGGTYQCLSDDGTSDPPHGMVIVDVLFAPKLSTHRNFVNAEAKGIAELFCDYRAIPKAKAYWFHKDNLLSNSDKYMINNTIYKNHHRTILTVNYIELPDLGDYICQAENVLGTDKLNVNIIFEPETPQFEYIQINGNKVAMHWIVRSKQALSEAVLDYKMNGTYSWSTATVINTKRNLTHSDMWKVTHEMDLVPGSWHARIRTKNTFGWSNFSSQYDFKILEDINIENKLGPDDMIMVAGVGVPKLKDNGCSFARGMPIFVILLQILICVFTK